MPDETRIYTVTQITREIREVLEECYSSVWVEGEVSNFTVSAAGHAYFSIKDKSAVLNCVMFKQDAARTVFDVADGMSVTCCGRVSVYDKRGQYQLYVKKMEPRGKGALQAAFEQLKEKLRKEGLFDEDRKKPLPLLPLHVGVVTSPTGAAIRDILNVACRRFPGVRITISPVAVQGAGAAAEIARGIEDINEYSLRLEEEGERPVDVIITGRGGGSIEDLWPFNEEPVARAIAASRIPVVSAVGHEVDFTISDFVADLRAPTPSAAAEIVVPMKKDITARLDDARGRMYAAVSKITDVLKKDLETLAGSYVLRSPMGVFLQLGQQVDELMASAGKSVSHVLQLKRGEFRAAEGKLRMLSPLAVLERGYSITFSGGRTVKDAARVKKGDELVTRFANGEVSSRVEKSGA